MLSIWAEVYQKSSWLQVPFYIFSTSATSGYQILTTHKSSDDTFTMAKGHLTGGALRRSIASVCGVAFLVCILRTGKLCLDML